MKKKSNSKSCKCVCPPKLHKARGDDKRNKAVHDCLYICERSYWKTRQEYKDCRNDCFAFGFM